MTARPVLKLVPQISIAGCGSPNQESNHEVSRFPSTFADDGSLPVIQQYKAGLLTPNALYRQLRSIWGPDVFERTRNSYTNMRARCRDGYAHLSDDLSDLASFMAAIGPRPTAAHSVDRIDNSGGYSATNIRWATKQEQARNRSSTLTFEIDGRKVTLQEASAISGESCRQIRARRSAGLSDERAVFGGKPRIETNSHVTGKLVFSEEAARKWDDDSLVEALRRARLLGRHEQGIAINELLWRKCVAEAHYERNYVPEEFEPDDKQILEMTRWADRIRWLRATLLKIYPDFGRQYQLSHFGYVV